MMESYKIRVNNEAESKEAQELFFELGYGWSSDQEKVVQTNQDAIDEGYSSDYQITFIFAAENGNLYHGSNTFDDYKSYVNDKGREVNLELLRDLVSLKNEKTVGSLLEGIEELREEYKDYHKDPALISGRDAWLTSFDGEHVQYRVRSSNDEWDSFNPQDWLIEDLKSNAYEFRLKPQTIKLELELPKPFEPKVGEKYYFIHLDNDNGYGFNYFESKEADACWMQCGVYQTKDKIKQVVEQLRKIKGAV